MSATAAPPQMGTGAASALVPAARKPGGEGHDQGLSILLLLPDTAVLAEPGPSVQLSTPHQERQTLPAGGGHDP